MNKINSALLFILIIALPILGSAQESNVSGMLETSFPSVDKENQSSRVTAVYGISADDYLPTKQAMRQQLRPNVRRSRSRPAFDLPDAFYFIGGPIFLILFLRVLVIFLNGFEEKRREEMRAAASESPHPTKSHFN